MNCKKCGATLKEGNLFCSQCGEPISKENVQKNDMPNMTYQKPKVEEQNVNYNPQPNQYSQQQYGQYNTYNSAATGNSKAGKIVIIVVIAIVFWIIGFFLGKLMFGGKNKETEVNNRYETSTSEYDNVAKTDKKEDKETEKSADNQSDKKSSGSMSTNYIFTMNHKKVTFKVADTLREDVEYSDKEIRFYKKESKDGEYDVDIEIQEEFSTIDEYMESIEESVNRQKSSGDYTSIELSEVKNKTVDGKKFYYAVIDWKMGDFGEKDACFVYEIEKDSLYTIEVEGYESLTEEELNGLLSIDISE